MSDDSSDDGMDDVVDAEAVDDGPGTELDVWAPDRAADGEPGAQGEGPGTGIDRDHYWLPASQDVVDAEIIEDPEDVIDAEIVEDIERALLGPTVTSDSAAASHGGAPTVYGPGGKGLGGGKLSRKDRKRRGLGGGGGGGGFTLFGFTLNVSALNGWGSGNSASLIGGRADRKAKAARLTRGGKHGSTGAMSRRMARARWLDRALGGGR